MCSSGSVGAVTGFLGGAIDMATNLYNDQQQASAARKNEERARGAQAEALRNGETTAARALMEAGFRLASQQVQAAGSGFDVSSGSFARVMQGSAQVSAMDVAQIRANAAKQALAFGQQADDWRTRKRSADVAMMIHSATGMMNIVARTLGGVSVERFAKAPTQPSGSETPVPTEPEYDFATTAPTIGGRGFGAFADYQDGFFRRR